MDTQFAARWVGSVVLACSSMVPLAATAATQSVSFTHLTQTATFANPFTVGDNLLVDTLVTTETGALSQTVTFTLAAAVGGLTGNAVWEVNPAASTGPRLTGVNIDIFNAANVLVASDTFAGVLGNFAVSNFSSAIGPGTYRLVATGTAIRDSNLDISLSFVSAIPEPHSYALWAAGLAGIGWMSLRRRRPDA